MLDIEIFAHSSVASKIAGLSTLGRFRKRHHAEEAVTRLAGVFLAEESHMNLVNSSLKGGF